MLDVTIKINTGAQQRPKITTDWMQPTINNFTKDMQRPIFTMVRMQPTLKTTSIYVQQ